MIRQTNHSKWCQVNKFCQVNNSQLLSLPLKVKTQDIYIFFLMLKVRHRGVNLNLYGSADVSKLRPLGALGLFWCWERTQWPPGFLGTALQVWGNQHWLLAAGQLNSRGDNGGLIQLLPKWDATSFMVFCHQRSVCLMNSQFYSLENASIHSLDFADSEPSFHVI